MKRRVFLLGLILTAIVATTLAIRNQQPSNLNSETTSTTNKVSTGKLSGCQFSSAIIQLCFSYDQANMGVVGETMSDNQISDAEIVDFYIASFSKSLLKAYMGTDFSGYTDPQVLGESVKQLEKVTSLDDKEFNLFLVYGFDNKTVSVVGSYLNPNDDNKSLWFIAEYPSDSELVTATKSQIKAIIASLKYEP